MEDRVNFVYDKLGEYLKKRDEIQELVDTTVAAIEANESIRNAQDATKAFDFIIEALFQKTRNNAYIEWQVGKEKRKVILEHFEVCVWGSADERWGND